MDWRSIETTPGDGEPVTSETTFPRLWPDPLDTSLNDPSSPAWQEGGRVHNWQNYIGERTRKLWHGFDATLKLTLASDADEAAGQEEWD